MNRIPNRDGPNRVRRATDANFIIEIFDHPAQESRIARAQFRVDGNHDATVDCDIRANSA
jgi:hypothetical protein